MKIAKYRQRLADFDNYVAACDPNLARSTGAWLRALSNYEESENALSLLLGQLDRVSRSLSAITILSKESAARQKMTGAVEVLDSSASDLRAELQLLQKECFQTEAVLTDRGLAAIVGEHLSSVSFVMDYIQLDFSGSTLTTFVPPLISRGTKTLTVGDQGFRDAICEMIGTYVTDVQVFPEKEIRIGFTEAGEISIPLRDPDAVGPEFAYFTSPSGFCCSW